MTELEILRHVAVLTHTGLCLLMPGVIVRAAAGKRDSPSRLVRVPAGLLTWLGLIWGALAGPSLPSAVALFPNLPVWWLAAGLASVSATCAATVSTPPARLAFGVSLLTAGACLGQIAY